MMTTKATIHSLEYVDLLAASSRPPSVTRSTTGLAEGTLPREIVDDVCMIIMVWLDPRCADHAELDKKDLYRTNYEATKIAIERALKGEPTVDELIAQPQTGQALRARRRRRLLRQAEAVGDRVGRPSAGGETGGER